MTSDGIFTSGKIVDWTDRSVEVNRAAFYQWITEAFGDDKEETKKEQDWDR